jgi:hypothetical protein
VKYKSSISLKYKKKEKNQIIIKYKYTLVPNSLRFAKFCSDFAINIREREAVSDGISLIKLNCRGFRIAGHMRRKNIKLFIEQKRQILFILIKNINTLNQS